MRRLGRARVLLTGASSGIGAALAVELARRHQARLILTARRAERLADVAREVTAAGGEAEVVPGDVTSDTHRSRLLEVAESTWGGLDVLVNNAGVGGLGPFAEASPERLRRIFEVNFFAPVELTRAALPLLRQSSGLIVNVASVLGHRSVPGKSEYSASKFALHGFSDALRAELRSDGVGVLLISPSTTSSEFFDAVIEDRGSKSQVSGSQMSPQRVARVAVSAMRRNRHEVILSWDGKALVWLDRLCPPLADWLVARFG